MLHPIICNVCRFKHKLPLIDKTANKNGLFCTVCKNVQIFISWSESDYIASSDLYLNKNSIFKTIILSALVNLEH